MEKKLGIKALDIYFNVKSINVLILYPGSGCSLNMQLLIRISIQASIAMPVCEYV